MTGNHQEKAAGVNKIVLVIVTVLVLGVFLFAFVQNQSGSEPSGTSGAESSAEDSNVLEAESSASSDSSEPTASKPDVSKPDESEPTVSEPVTSEPIVSEPVSSEPVQSEPEPEPEPGSKPQKFTIPKDILSYFSKSLIDLYGYEPWPPDGGYNGGDVFTPPGCPYELVYGGEHYDAPVAILGEISRLIPGKSSYTEQELIDILGGVPIDFYWSESDGNYYGRTEPVGYTIWFLGEPGDLSYFDIREYP